MSSENVASTVVVGETGAIAGSRRPRSAWSCPARTTGRERPEVFGGCAFPAAVLHAGRDARGVGRSRERIDGEKRRSNRDVTVPAAGPGLVTVKVVRSRSGSTRSKDDLDGRRDWMLDALLTGTTLMRVGEGTPSGQARAVAGYGSRRTTAAKARTAGREGASGSGDA